MLGQYVVFYNVGNILEIHMTIFTIYLVRHENRLLNALYDCSLTNDGIYSSQSDMIEKIYHEHRKFNIYCSPTLRTLQTIYTYAKHNDVKINLEDSLYEFMCHWTSQYIYMDNIPKITSDMNMLCLYHDHYNYLLEIKDLVSQLSNMDSHDTYYKDHLYKIKNSLTRLIFMVNDDHLGYLTKKSSHYIKNIYDVIEKMTYVILCTDIATSKGYIDDPYFIAEIKKHGLVKLMNIYIDDAINIFELFNMMLTVNNNYESLINLNKIAETYKIEKKRKETYEDIIIRTHKLSFNIINNNQYQNSIYVSHLTTINAIIVNLYKLVYKNDHDALHELNARFETNYLSFADFCEKNIIKVGLVKKIIIDTDKNTIDMWTQ